jgi:hypothetical protein
MNCLSGLCVRPSQRTLDRTHIDSDDGEESDESDSNEGQQLDDDSDEESKEKVDSVAKGSKRYAANLESTLLPKSEECNINCKVNTQAEILSLAQRMDRQIIY